MKRKQMKKHVLKHASKCMAVRVLAFTMVLQLCFSFTALAYAKDFSYGYPYWDDPDAGYYSRYDDNERKLTDVTRTYDDGTTYTSAYRYDDKGNLISADIKEPDGSKSSMTRTYRGETLVSQTTYEYDASDKSEETDVTEYAENGYPAHTLQKHKYSDGTSESEEVWFIDRSKPQKYVAVDTDGITTQIDLTYDEEGQEIARVTTSSDGSTKQEEWRYNEFGDVTYYKLDEYDALVQEKNTSETRIEGEGESKVKYITETKILIDGSQSTANYTYNADGEEILYTRNHSDGTTEKRETFHTKTGKETVYTDGKGLTGRSTVSYDTKNNQTVSEETISMADGSSSYMKCIYDEYYNTVYYLYKEKKADGTEAYIEKNYKPDGSCTKKEKSADGVITVTEIDADGNTVIRHSTLMDGTKTETSWTWQENGLVTSEVTRYSDGAEDRINYEYDENGNLVKKTETRRNGVSAVYLVQHNETDRFTGTQTITFNNGYQVAYTAEIIDADTEQIAFTYSVGDVYQDIIVEKGSENLYLKTIYRDGRIEEASLNMNSDEDFYQKYEKVIVISDRFDSFLEQAWSVLPSQDPAVATSSDAV